MCNVEDSIKSEQNLTHFASGSSQSLSNVRDDICNEGMAVHNINKIKVNDLKTDVKASGREEMSSSNDNTDNKNGNSARCSSARQNIARNNRRKLILQDINVEIAELAEK